MSSPWTIMTIKTESSDALHNQSGTKKIVISHPLFVKIRNLDM